MPRVGRTREKNRRLPIGWDQKPSGFYFRPTNERDRAIVRALTGKLSLPLGKTMDQASETFADLIVKARRREDRAEPGTIAELCQLARVGRFEPGDQNYMPPFLPSIKNPKTREERERHIDELDLLFGTRRYALNVYEASKDFRAVTLRAMDVQRHIMRCTSTRPVAVNRAVRSWELLFAWTRAPWGLTEYNPCSGLKMNEEAPRMVVPEDVKIRRLYRELSPPARWMLAMIRYYGRRKVELIRVQTTDARDDGLHLTRGKRAKAIVLRWESRLRRYWHRLMLWRAKASHGAERIFLDAKGKPRVNADGTAWRPALLNTKGRPLTVSGFNSERKRAMQRAGMKGEFTYHDVRKTRADSLDTLDEAAHVLAHDDKRTTATKYRVGAHVIDLSHEVAKKRGPK
jgi:hypothetical protein